MTVTNTVLVAVPPGPVAVKRYAVDVVGATVVTPFVATLPTP